MNNRAILFLVFFLLFGFSNICLIFFFIFFSCFQFLRTILWNSIAIEEENNENSWLHDRYTHKYTNRGITTSLYHLFFTPLLSNRMNEWMNNRYSQISNRIQTERERKEANRIWSRIQKKNDCFAVFFNNNNNYTYLFANIIIFFLLFFFDTNKMVTLSMNIIYFYSSLCCLCICADHEIL